MQKYKERREAEDRLRSRTSLERIRCEQLLTESRLKRKKAEEEAKYAAMKLQENIEKNNTQAADGSTLMRLSMTEDTRTIDNSPQKRNGELKGSSMRGDKSVSDITTIESQSPLAKLDSSDDYNLQDLKEDLSRMKLTIQLLKESNMNIVSERRLSEEMYHDEILKMMAALKVAQEGMKNSKGEISSLTDEIESLKSTNMKIREELDEKNSLITKMSEKSDTTHKKPVVEDQPNVMVSISSKSFGLASEKSAADCEGVDIDDIKGRLLKKFGWTEVGESELDDAKVTQLREEIELLKQQNNTLVDILKENNIEIKPMSSDEKKQSRPSLTSTPSKRRIYAHPGSASPSMKSTPRKRSTNKNSTKGTDKESSTVDK